VARLKPILIPDLERIIEFDLVRARQPAALNASQGMERVVADRSVSTLANENL